MTTQDPAEPSPEVPSDEEISDNSEAPNPGILWAAVFLASIVIFSIVSVKIFPGRDGRRDVTDWVLICVLPLLVGITLSTFVLLLAGLRARHSAPGRHAGDTDGTGPKSPAAEPPPPFSEWLANEWAASQNRSLSAALNKYIVKFELQLPGVPDEPKELSVNRTKLTILKESLLPDPRWKEAPELKEYIEDLEFLLSSYDPIPPAEGERRNPGQ